MSPSPCSKSHAIDNQAQRCLCVCVCVTKKTLQHSVLCAHKWDCTNQTDCQVALCGGGSDKLQRSTPSRSSLNHLNTRVTPLYSYSVVIVSRWCRREWLITQVDAQLAPITHAQQQQQWGACRQRSEEGGAVAYGLHALVHCRAAPCLLLHAACMPSGKPQREPQRE